MTIDLISYHLCSCSRSKYLGWVLRLDKSISKRFLVDQY
jgi:hypothetical protein